MMLFFIRDKYSHLAVWYSLIEKLLATIQTHDVLIMSCVLSYWACLMNERVLPPVYLFVLDFFVSSDNRKGAPLDGGGWLTDVESEMQKLIFSLSHSLSHTPSHSLMSRPHIPTPFLPYMYQDCNIIYTSALRKPLFIFSSEFWEWLRRRIT